MNKYGNVSGRKERVMLTKKVGNFGGRLATDIWVWCGLCVLMLGAVEILSSVGVKGRVLRCDEGIYEDVVSGEVGLSVLCSWEYPLREMDRTGWDDEYEEEDVVFDVAGSE